MRPRVAEQQNGQISCVLECWKVGRIGSFGANDSSFKPRISGALRRPKRRAELVTENGQ